MTIGKVLYYLGIALVIWALISGIHFAINMDDSGLEYGSTFTFKAGKIILGIILILLGRRLENN